MDIVGKNVEALKSILPGVFTGGKVDFEALRQALGDAVDEGEERYGLAWPGKRAARRAALTPSAGTLRPSPEKSVNWDSTRNLVIEGDNLEVLKLLQKPMAGRVKAIYIDPPYNTGREFIYPDHFSEPLRTYLRYTGQMDAEGKVSGTNAETDGRYHSKWLSMMYPRLCLARSLLANEGAIFISIDDHEVDNLRKLCGEIFGEDNFVACVIWQKVFSPKNSARHLSEDHDYVVIYAKSADVWRPRLLPRSAEADARYENPDNDDRGPWTSSDLTARNHYGEGTYEVTSPSGRAFSPARGRYWSIKKADFLKLDADKRIWWGATGSGMPRLKRFLSDVKRGIVPRTLWTYGEVGHTQEAKKELLESVPFGETDNVMDSVKPTRLIRRILQIATNPESNDIVLDFFAGTGATGAAVLAQNAEDGGNRRFILVQLPEPLPKPEKHLKTIADITRERVRRVGETLAEEKAGKPGVRDGRARDSGFRAFKLATSSLEAWNPDRAQIRAPPRKSVETLEPDRTELDVLYEVLLKLGLDLAAPLETKSIAGKPVHSVGGALMACLSRQVTRDEIEPLGLGIVEWRKALAPAGETTCVFRESAFEDDAAKARLTAILRQNGLTDVRSL